MTEDEKPIDKIKKGFKKVLGGSAGVVEGTAEGVKEVAEDAAEGTKEGVEKATNSETYTSTDEERRDYNEAGGKEPMNPEDIGEGAIDRGQDTGITGEEHSDTDSPEAKEKYRKKGMTEV